MKYAVVSSRMFVINVSFALCGAIYTFIIYRFNQWPARENLPIWQVISPAGWYFLVVWSIFAIWQWSILTQCSMQMTNLFQLPAASWFSLYKGHRKTRVDLIGSWLVSWPGLLLATIFLATVYACVAAWIDGFQP
jgi:hypothetical protein